MDEILHRGCVPPGWLAKHSFVAEAPQSHWLRRGQAAGHCSAVRQNGVESRGYEGCECGRAFVGAVVGLLGGSGVHGVISVVAAAHLGLGPRRLLTTSSVSMHRQLPGRVMASAYAPVGRRTRERRSLEEK